MGNTFTLSYLLVTIPHNTGILDFPICFLRVHYLYEGTVALKESWLC